MAAVTSTAGYQAITQAAFQQLKVQQARQNAERAEQTAETLRARAADAQRTADRAQESARSLYVQSREADSAAGQARQGVALIQSTSEARAQLANTVSQASERFSPEVSVSETTSENSAPVRNTSGQITGRVVNTTA
ncbi:MAG: hypothetical protein AB1642_07475 [Pseudomonadota bacterium]